MGTSAGLLVALVLLVLALTATANLYHFPRLHARRLATPPGRVEVSVLVPARDEADQIGETVSTLLAQEGAAFELLVLDDDSRDGTGAEAAAAGAGTPHFRLLSGQPLPPGWLGKNWACHQLAQAAEGRWLIFADADVRWSPGSLAALLASAGETDAEVITVWPTQETVTWSERLVVPLVSLAILAYLPAWAVHHTRSPAFAAANGQCLAFRRAAYAASGGHDAVRGEVVEDVALARRAKRAGLRLRMVDGAGLIRCRMYDSWPAVRDGFAKNIVAGHGDRLPFLLLSTLFHWLVFVWPWLWWLAGGGNAALLLGVAGMLLRAVTAGFSRQRRRDAVLLPLSVLLMSVIAARAAWWHVRGQTEWKGRRVVAGT